MGRVLGEDFDDSRWIANVRRALELCQPVDENEFVTAAAVLIPMHLRKIDNRSAVSIVRNALNRIGAIRDGAIVYCMPASHARIGSSLFFRVAAAYADGNTSLSGLRSAFPKDDPRTICTYRYRIQRGMNSSGRKRREST